MIVRMGADANSVLAFGASMWLCSSLAQRTIISTEETMGILGPAYY